MRQLIILGLTAFILRATCAAQFRPCAFTEASTVNHREGITRQRVGLAEPTGEVKATVLIPDSDDPLPGIVFSHSAIHGADRNADLLRFAWTLARAGAASIVLDGAIEWQIPNDESIRDPHLMACAGQWLLLHGKLDRHRLAVAGPLGGWGGGDTPYCQAGEFPCWPAGPWLNFGQTSPAEVQNTEEMLTPQGQLRMAQDVQRYLKLREIDAEWFSNTAERSPK